MAGTKVVWNDGGRWGIEGLLEGRRWSGVMKEVRMENGGMLTRWEVSMVGAKVVWKGGGRWSTEGKKMKWGEELRRERGSGFWMSLKMR